ncbi:hypothetical protein B5M09_002119 [Aphanomyces astaci]|uniref:Folate receptor-like domain-containing protein n=1 Tax=Aphanomyces astaci TaxID=112090 RepID=A0A397CG03_APHAT|nr:hypothetical protein DYB38_005865 [Aphanomyces astaci]RHY76646.1 hypothetical protein DYB34_002112 [Aphanomyces astaci]RHY83609.1 hypothetical protein DYB31_006187 [Aphanomyces astaci]RQM30667.1 hypothetical protein B5M09_002119 [Aphanomyces astaci]
MSRSRREQASSTPSQPLCRSTGGIKFDPTEPSRQQKQRSLDHCTKYWQNSCCNATHTIPLKRRVMEPIVALFNSKCQALHDEMTCSACHPFVGTGRLERICPDLCDDWFDACKDEYYTPDGSQALSPCYGNALICSPLHSIAMGYTPGKSTDTEGVTCFDGSVPDELGVAEPEEHMADALFRMFAEQSEEPTEFMLVVVLVAIVGLFVSVKFFRRWSDEHNALKMEETRRRQQEAYRQAYHLGKSPDDATSDADSSDDDDDDLDFAPAGEEAAAASTTTGRPSTPPSNSS